MSHSEWHVGRGIGDHPPVAGNLVNVRICVSCIARLLRLAVVMKIILFCTFRTVMQTTHQDQVSCPMFRPLCVDGQKKLVFLTLRVCTIVSLVSDS